jgi:hypothetical protein
MSALTVGGSTEQERLCTMTTNLQERFWEQVDPRDSRRCWEWQGSRYPSHYGRIRAAGTSYRAHRVAWTLFYGEIPSGMFVCHTCDNPPCVNPSHLFLGDSAANHKDMEAKGRNARGEIHGRAKLTNHDVQIIRARWINGAGVVALAAEYGVSHSRISEIVHRKVWTHV